MVNGKAPAKKHRKQANAAGKSRNVDKQKIKSSKNLTSLLSMGSDLRIRTKAVDSKPTKSNKKTSLFLKKTKKEEVEVNKFEKLWNKTDRILRSRSISKYNSMPQVCIREGKKISIFIVLLREHNCDFSNFVKSVQVQSPWIPGVILDTMCHSIQKAAFEIGWCDLLGDPSLVIENRTQLQNGSGVVEKTWKQTPFRGALQKLEKFRTSLTKRNASRESNILLPMLQRAATRVYSNFKATTANGAAPYEELSAAQLSDLTGYKKSFFVEIGRPCLALTLFDLWFGSKCMLKLIDEIPKGVKFQNTQQRALKTSASTALKNNDTKFRTSPIYKDISEWVFPSAF